MTEHAPPASASAPLPALVVGLSIHGLAVARALAQRGVPVHCLSDVETPPQPTTYTRYARVHFRRNLNTGPLKDFLLEIAEQIGSPHKLVLFPTSDRIAKAAALAWPELSDRYLLSWAHCRELVLTLQRKDSLAEYCERAGVVYPRSQTLLRAEDYAAAAQSLRFPLVVKPAQPLSSFKAIRVRDLAELRQCVEQYASDLPFVLQEWVEGPEPSLYSCTAYVDRGAPLYMLTSRKIAAYPPGLGQGTVFETIADRETQEITERFLRQLDLTGPVAVEFKRDAAGQFWLIEPNVGRTEYCVDLAIQSGFNLPYVEYLHTTGGPWRNALPQQTQPCAWFDTDKDPACFVRHLSILRDEQGRKRRAVFPFLGHSDWVPLAQSLRQQASSVLRGLPTRIAHAVVRPSQA